MTLFSLQYVSTSISVRHGTLNLSRSSARWQGSAASTCDGPATKADRPLFLDEATFADASGSDGLAPIPAAGVSAMKPRGSIPFHY
jgi:hypothetical protein